MLEEEEVKANMKEIAEKAPEGKKIKSMPDVCETPQSPSEPVPIPYPNTAMSNDTSSGSKKVKVEAKEVTEKSSFEKSMGDEPSSSGWKSITNVIKKATGSEVLNIPLWIWGIGVVVILFAVWILVTNNSQLTEPIEQRIVELIAATK